MTQMILAGPLAAPEMLAVLGCAGDPVDLPGQMRGGAGAGIGGDWPEYQPGERRVAAVSVEATPQLLRYLEVMGLSPLPLAPGEVWGFGSGEGQDWQPDKAALMALTAQAILTRNKGQSPQHIRARLTRIAEIAAAVPRAAFGPLPQTHLPQPDPARVEIQSRDEVWGGYFSVEQLSLRHRRHDGGWSNTLSREAFMSADAALLLPYDPARDEVLVISQIRIGPLARGQAQVWMLEPIAGRVDAGEPPEATARREAVEEAGLQIGRLYPLPEHYPSPGANSEFFYPFVGTADLSGHRTGHGFGVAGEGEDIATYILPRPELVALALNGQIQCGPLVLLALWLDRHAAQIRQDAADPDARQSGDLAGS